MDKFSDEFMKIVLKHVETIPEDEYKKHTALSETGQSLFTDDTFRGFATRATRRELIEEACSVSAIRACSYIGVFLNDDTATIGHVEMNFEGEYINSPVYYFPDRGIYAAACGNSRVYDAWLSWPCYPNGW